LSAGQYNKKDLIETSRTVTGAILKERCPKHGYEWITQNGFGQLDNFMGNCLVLLLYCGVSLAIYTLTEFMPWSTSTPSDESRFSTPGADSPVGEKLIVAGSGKASWCENY